MSSLEIYYKRRLDFFYVLVAKGPFCHPPSAIFGLNNRAYLKISQMKMTLYVHRGMFYFYYPPLSLTKGSNWYHNGYLVFMKCPYMLGYISSSESLSEIYCSGRKHIDLFCW